MSSLWFIVRKSIKNSLLSLRHNRGRLVLYILVAALIVSVGVISFMQESEPGDNAPLFWLTLIWFAYTAFFAFNSVINGLSSGGSFFEMSDVNLLFVSPLNQRSILVYGMTKLMKSSFLAAFFILFQSSTLKTFFNASYVSVWFMMLVFMVSLACLTVIALVIYVWVNGRENRKRVVKALTAFAHAPAVVYFAARMIDGRTVTDALSATVQSAFVGGIPVTGWAARSVTSAVAGDWPYAWAFLGLMAGAMAAALLYVIGSHADYYEDVLCATETAFERKRAITEGNINAVNTNSRSIKVAATGIGGHGASVLLHKHMREMLRENRFGLVGLPALILTVAAAAASAAMKGTVNLVIIAAVMMYIQIMKVGTGRGLKELFSHYIFMIPEPPFLKIVWSSLETVLKALVECVLVFGVSGVILGESPAVILCAVLAYTLFTFFLLGVNYLSMRYAGPDISPAVLSILYMFGMVILMVPGAVPALIVGVMIGGTAGSAAGLLIMAAWEVLAAVVCFLLSKGILHTCEIQVLKTIQ